MKRVKAARLHNYDGAEAVRVEDTSLPEPRPGELTVRVHAAGVNLVSRKIRSGYLRLTAEGGLTGRHGQRGRRDVELSRRTI